MKIGDRKLKRQNCIQSRNNHAAVLENAENTQIDNTGHHHAQHGFFLPLMLVDKSAVKIV